VRRATARLPLLRSQQAHDNGRQGRLRRAPTPRWVFRERRPKVGSRSTTYGQFLEEKIIFSENDPRGGPPRGSRERSSFLTVIIVGACPLDLDARGRIWGSVDAWQRPNLPNGVSPLAQSSAWVRSENQTSSTLFVAAAQVGNCDGFRTPARSLSGQHGDRPVGRCSKAARERNRGR